MKDILQKVRGAVATKDLVPALTHFHIYNGRIQGGNNLLSIDAPVEEFDGFEDMTVNAEDFIRAIDACGEDFYLTVDDDHVLIEQGKKKIRLAKMNPAAYPLVEVSKKGTTIKSPGVDMFRAVRPFVGNDVTRMWACGVLIESGYIYATNNVVLVRTPYESKVKGRYNIPAETVDELIRLDDEPVETIAVEQDSISFLFDDDYWLRSKLLINEWPDTGPLFASIKSKLPKVDPGLYEAVKTVLPFCPDKNFPEIIFSGDTVTTGGDIKKKNAAVSGLANLHDARFRAEALLSVLEVATHIDLKPYPKPCPFRGDGIEGVIIGLRE